ncbi:ABC transporter permease [Pseudonocardia sp.]|uniref:ABC transporter permease n=1 Tax=Pseudonocardia sp. TaxID=60912 RepID=UPI0026064E5D|nr:ABC transporter permease subunit [Pseudonocardia sp.]MCW2717620.1 binding-protein-dependent transport system inner rane component [Pseudonocardia sp.]MDT7613263.1 NitT/TauT family transport system permease protein [Pseudonocardiales bacterium]
MTRPAISVDAAPPPTLEAPPSLAVAGSPGRPWWRGALVRTTTTVLALAGIAAVWYAVSYLVLPSDQRFLLPPPDQAYGTALSNPNVMGPMLEGLGRSVAVAIIGLAIAVVIGIGWAVVMSQFSWAEKILYPYAVILQTIPILALVPLIGIWMGYGFPARITVCVIIAVFPMISNTFFGLQSATAEAHDLMTLNRATRAQRLLKLQFPAAVPSIFTGLRNAAGLAVIGAIVGDFFFQQGSPGIGGLLRVYTQRLSMEPLLTAVTLTALFGVAFFTAFAALDRAVVGRWYGRASR